MHIILEMPALLRIVIVFVCILIAIRRNLSLGNAFLLGAVTLGLLFGLGPIAMLKSVLHAVLDAKTISLAVIVSLILILSSSMEISGQMQRLLGGFGRLKSPRLNLIFFPALIGLLPMPGGAVFSAPMVKEFGALSGLKPEEMSFINYWFRHIWEYWWPLYPGVLLAITLSDISLWIFMPVMFPLTVVVVILGMSFLRGTGTDKRDESGDHADATSLAPFLRELLPIALVIVLGLGSGVILSKSVPAFTVAKESGLIFALSVAIVMVWRTNAMTHTQVKEALFNPQLLNMIYMVFAILIFNGMLEESHAVGIINSELRILPVPLAFLVIVLPFLVGGLVAITMAFVGSTFPILIALVNAFGQSGHLLDYLMLAYVSGYAGVMLSPLHLCLILSNEYFNADLPAVYRYILPRALALLAFGIIYFWILKDVIGI